MERMHGRDANFLYQETPSALMHTIKIQIVDIPEGQAELKSVVDGLANLLGRAPLLRKRVVMVPGGLHHPLLMDDPNFDIGMHVFRARLPMPGTRVELDEMIAQISSNMLDRSRPLWELWALEGFEENRMAFVLKIHHCLADGMASVGFITRVFDTSLSEEDPPEFIPKVPSNPRLILGAFKDHILYDVVRFPAFLVAAIKSIRNLLSYSKTGFAPTIEVVKGDVPRLPWNRALSSRRNFATFSVPIQELREIKAVTGGTLNDIVLTVGGGALRRYLQEHDCLPDAPLVTAVPVAVDEAGVVRQFGNNTASLMVLLFSNIEDPLERLSETRRVTKAAKAELEVLGKHTYGNVVHYIPPGLWSWYRQRQYRTQAADNASFTPATNITISNVPGPRTMLGQLSDLFSVGPLIEGVGLNITVWSYNGNMNFSILGCKRSIPDIRRIADHMQPAIDELHAAADALRQNAAA